MWRNICHYIFSSLLSLLLKITFSLYKSSKSKQEVSMAWKDLCFLFFCFVNDFKNQNKKFLSLDKTFVSCYLTLFMVSITKTTHVHHLLRTLFLVLLLCFWLKTKTATFCALKRHLHLVSLLRLWLQKPEPEVSMTWNLKICVMKDWGVWQNQSQVRISAWECLTFQNFSFHTLGREWSHAGRQEKRRSLGSWSW